jgi:hypothetical protein
MAPSALMATSGIPTVASLFKEEASLRLQARGPHGEMDPPFPREGWPARVASPAPFGPVGRVLCSGQRRHDARGVTSFAQGAPAVPREATGSIPGHPAPVPG